MDESVRDHLTQALAGRYTIERELGSGGMATVYLAQDVRHARRVAVKVLRRDLGMAIGSTRFLAEIRVTANLQHPNILPLLDSGEAGGFSYYVMPFVVGETLRERLTKTGALPILDAVKILSDVVDALAAAHSLGVVHRDIKPENVMLSGRHALVTDFGIAKAVTDATARNKATTEGVALGTPAYMAPEQAAADAHLDQRVDIYAVGALGYELLSGRAPFAGMTNQQILAAHVTQVPDPLMNRRPTCPPTLAALIMKCLEKRPEDRFQNADALFAELEKLATPTEGITPTKRVTERSRTARTHLAKLAIGAAITAVFLTGATYWLLLHRSKSNPFVLRDRVRLTATGTIINPAISPDGAELAYQVPDCQGGSCAYDVEVKLLGGAETQRPLRGASFVGRAIRWSTDRRNLIVEATIDGRSGAYLLPALGGAPHFITPFIADFWAGGDSIVFLQRNRLDSVLWLRFAGLDLVAHDSIRIVGPADRAIPNTVPGSQWIVAMLGLGPVVRFRAVSRDGTVGGEVVLRSLVRHRMSRDALWALVREDDANSLRKLVRIAFAPRTGRFSAHADTVNVGEVTHFDVTADGRRLVFDEGTSEYSAWAVNLEDAFKGDFNLDKRLFRATTPVVAWLSHDGEQVVLGRDENSSVGGDEVTVRPFEGGAEKSLAHSGVLIIAGDASPEPNSILMRTETPRGSEWMMTDLRSGARQNRVAVPPGAVFTALSAGGWAWLAPGGGVLNVQHSGEKEPRTFTLPSWFGKSSEGSLSASPDGQALSYFGSDSSENEMRLSILSLSTGKFTPWLTYVSLEAFGRWLPDGSILLLMEEPLGIYTVNRMRGPERKERLGNIPRPITGISISDDLRRAVIVTRDHHGDAWMSSVTPP